jgi:hypothetical protein
MKMRHTYGIFDDEADHLIDLVRRHAPLAQVRSAGCPACGAAMNVEFAEAGTWFLVCCEGKPLHISKHQDIADPPPWWRECVIPPTDSTFYWRETASFDASGKLTIMASGVRADGVHWSGAFECAPGHSDYPFWNWVLSQSGYTSDLINDSELAKLRARFEKRT